MAVSKVQKSTGEVLIDLTGDTVTADKLMQGYTAHDRSGAVITGTATGGGGSVTLGYDESVSVGNALVGSAVTAEPFYIPSGDLVISGASEYMTNATVELNYSYASSTLTISGVTIMTTKSTPSLTFIGNGVNFTIEEVNT